MKIYKHKNNNNNLMKKLILYSKKSIYKTIMKYFNK